MNKHLTQANVAACAAELFRIIIKNDPEVGLSAMASITAALVALMGKNNDVSLDHLQSLYLAMRSDLITNGNQLRLEITSKLGLGDSQ